MFDVCGKPRGKTSVGKLVPLLVKLTLCKLQFMQGVGIQVLLCSLAVP